MKDILMEILMEMNDLQGINNTADEAENQINYMEHKETKKQHSRTSRRKNPPK